MTCRVCNGPNREAIDKALITGTPFRHIAAQYGTSTGALQRHKKDHLPQALIKAKEALEIARGDDLIAQMRDLNRRTRVILDKAETSNDLNTALKAIGENRRNQELIGKLIGELGKQEPPDVHQTLHLHNIPTAKLKEIIRTRSILNRNDEPTENTHLIEANLRPE